MKYFRFFSLLLLVSILSFTACDSDSGNGDDNSNNEITFDNANTAGQIVTVKTNNVTFSMNFVPGGLTFPTGTSDNSTATVKDAYFIGETEVTYKLWYEVYTWATSGTGGATGEGQYTFVHAGVEGHDGSIGAEPIGQEPVTTITWRDMIVWCNAMTEWYNAQKGTDYECVYTYSSAIIRNSTSSNCDSASASSTAEGFRLLTSNEWELAARYRGSDTTNVVTGTISSVDFDAMTIKWTKGNSVSGDTQAYNATTPTVGNYAVYASSSSAAVKTKTANALGIFDMSGNVGEFTFSGSRIQKGGAYGNGANYMLVGYSSTLSSSTTFADIGFRIAKTQ